MSEKIVKGAFQLPEDNEYFLYLMQSVQARKRYVERLQAGLTLLVHTPERTRGLEPASFPCGFPPSSPVTHMQS